MIVGIGGNNGVTCVAGLLANRKKLEWEGSKRRVKADWKGCVTQGNENLVNFGNAEIGGWDIRKTKLGDALVEARILDRDLALMVKDEMNSIDVMQGVWDKRYIGESQHETADHFFEGSHLQKLEKLRKDIRKFQQKVNGHTTVVWSANVESHHMLDPVPQNAEALMRTLETNAPVPPSVLYALAAAMEGCSFVNGGSQDTLTIPGLLEFFTDSYCLGTDFKSGQTKAKTAVVEYLRKLAFQVKVVASSNHLGNNDLKSLLSKPQQDAKLRVKHDIFRTGDDEAIDHTVSLMYTPYIGDEKRDYVEYTSEAFLSQIHTMVTYSRCSDSVLCAPLIIDACVWCDAFRFAGASHADVAKATAYLFKVPEFTGSSLFFFDQLQDLDAVCRKYDLDMKPIEEEKPEDEGSATPTTTTTTTPKRVAYPARAEGGRFVVAAGLACLDIELLSAVFDGRESINEYDGSRSKAGGSAPQVATAVAALGQNAAVIARLGNDMSAQRLVELMDPERTGIATAGCTFSELLNTGNAIVPVFADGRGCYYDAGSNREFSPDDILEGLMKLTNVGALHVGYPHLLPRCRGEDLANVLVRLNLVTSLDLNGVPPTAHLGDGVIDAPASVVDVLHANADEARLLLRMPENRDPTFLALSLLHRTGAALVAVTDGDKGAALAVADDARVASSHIPLSWAGKSARVPAYAIPDGTTPNTNGAGDAFCAGLLATLVAHADDPDLSLDEVARIACLSAHQRVANLPEPRSLDDFLLDLRHSDRGRRSGGFLSKNPPPKTPLPPELPLQ